MLQKNADGFYTSSLLTQATGIVHGFSSRGMGDMRQEAIFKRGLGSMHVPMDSLIQVKQVHSADVAIATPKDKGTVIPNKDGVLATGTLGPVSLAVVVADCVPLLLVDPVARVIVAVHAGWKGTLAGVATRAFVCMKEQGAHATDMYAAIGPHIGGCCYTVQKDRIEAFEEKFDVNTNAYSYFNDAWHLDLAFLNVKQLLDSGVNPKHIDAHPTCTSCQNDEYFSYRKDTKETFGEMVAVIGLI